VSLRRFIGLCEHVWQDTGHLHTRVPNRWRTSLDEPAFLTTRIEVTQRCTKCGKVRSVEL
jgi:hypothetical protein